MQSQPRVLLPGEFSEEDVRELKAANKIWKTVDIYSRQVEELAEISYPGGDSQKRQEFIDQKGDGDLAGAWVYYPWSGTLMHCVGEDDLFALRTNRNQNLITKDEQKTLSQATVAVAGMSVGSGIALSCVYSGMSNTIKLADFDELSTANLNRLRESVSDVGTPKIDLATQHVYEINPFAKVETLDRITIDTMDGFLRNTSVVFDEIDDFEMKIRLRIAAKAAKIPVIMLTSLGDNILVDVERYDLDADLPLFHGLLGDLPEEILNAKIGEKEKVKYAMQLVGINHIPTRALASLMQINKTLVGRPQLYSTIAVDGGLAAYLVRRLVLGQPLPSARGYVSFGTILDLPAISDGERESTLKQLRDMANS